MTWALHYYFYRACLQVVCLRELLAMKITWVFAAFLLIYAHIASAQVPQVPPRLYLFENQTNQATLNLFIGGREPRPLSLVTNENISSLIVDEDSSSFAQFIVEVTNATSEESQAIQINTTIDFDSSVVIGDGINTFVFNFADRSGPISMGNLSIILSTLRYVADLPSTSVGETRVVRVFVYDDGSNDTLHRGEPSTATLTLRQDNIDSPTFNATNYEVSVPEDTMVNTVILTVNATDEAGLVLYELVNDSIPLSINSTSGDIYIHAPLDFEATSIYDFEIQAVDLDEFNPLTATALVRVFITDINDEAPVFVCNPCNLTAQEEVFLPLTPIISATDVDTVGDPLIYNFSNSDYQSASEFFTISSTTGQITVIGRLDYDSPTNHRSFTFTVTAFDGVLIGSTTVFIEVLDGQDLIPTVFLSDPNVCYNLDIGTTMVVLDPDVSARDDSSQLISGMARLTQDSVSLTNPTCTHARTLKWL